MLVRISASGHNILALLQVPKVGPARVRKELAVASDIGSDPHEHLSSVLGQATGMPMFRQSQAWRESVSILEQCDELDISVITALDDAYPVDLLRIRDYPPVLFVRGDATAMRAPCFAVVGTRASSALGASWAHKIARRLAESGVGVVSGLALGIDTAAHEGCLAEAGRTVAVLAHGLHTIMPKANTALGEKILVGGGALISEHPPGTPPRPPEFVRRNRIQSGLSSASIIVESGESGGAIHQAKFAADQGRAVYVVQPSETGGLRSGFIDAGAQRLQRELGARTIGSQEELMAAILASTETGQIRQKKTVEGQSEDDPIQGGFAW